jgi:DNA modification methylase
MPRVGSSGLPKPYWETSDQETIRLYLGDALTISRELPVESVQCIITSPPYWGLRDYGTSVWEGGSGENCQHSEIRGGTGERGVVGCLICGARRVDYQLGREDDPEEYLGKIVQIFRELRRVLREDGTVWLNLGDSYASEGRRTYCSGASTNRGHEIQNGLTRLDCGLPTGNLVGIPWRTALALQADGWILRQEIIWHKSNAMPESVRNRCTKSHESIFLLTRSLNYFCDMKAISTPAINEYSERIVKEGGKVLNQSSSRSLGMKPTGNSIPGSVVSTGRRANKRSVWTIPLSRYEGEHCATFPEELVLPCLRAGTSAGGACARCGSPQRRGAGKEEWIPGCLCGEETRPCIVLDPFLGTGTTAVVSLSSGRWCWGIDLSESYLRDGAIPRIEGVLCSRPGLSTLLLGKPRVIPIGKQLFRGNFHV